MRANFNPSIFLLLAVLALQGCHDASAPATGDETVLKAFESPKDAQGKQTFRNSVILQVDSETLSFSTPTYMTSRRVSADGVRSTVLELSDGKTQKLTLVLHAASDRESLVGQYEIRAAVADGGKVKPDTAEFAFIQSLDAERGRRLYPGGAGSVTVAQDNGVYQINMMVYGDGAFRPKDSAPMRAQVSFKPQVPGG